MHLVRGNLQRLGSEVYRNEELCDEKGKNYPTNTNPSPSTLASNILPDPNTQILVPIKETSLSYDTSSDGYLSTRSSVFVRSFAFDLQAPMKRKKIPFVSLFASHLWKHNLL